MTKLSALALVFVTLYTAINCGIVFTGHADVDFDPSNPTFTQREIGALHGFISEQSVVPSDYMISKDRVPGMDVDVVQAYYDADADRLYVGVQCKGICGDSDGDGNPGGVDPLGTDLGSDSADMCLTESISLMWWNNVPMDYEPTADGTFFFPTFTTGVDYKSCIYDQDEQKQYWLAYQFPNYTECLWPIPRDDPYNDCVFLQTAKVATPGDPKNAYDMKLVLSEMWKQNASLPHLTEPKLYTLFPNITAPHIEFYLENFSQYPEFRDNFVPGKGIFRLGNTGVSACPVDPVGEDFILPKVWTIKYDCDGAPNGNLTYDVCGVCNGDGSSCWDCAHVSNGGKDYDDCGICGGNGESCKCVDYLGYDLEAVDYALLRWTISASLSKINQTLEVLTSIRRSLPNYDYENGDISLNDYIDTIHDFCDNCLDNFDNAQKWFSEYLSGACEGLDCENPIKPMDATWSL